MFTGLVSDVGRVVAAEDKGGVRRLSVESAYPASALQLGASVMHAGVCLTLVEFGARPEGGSRWMVEAVQETLNRTTLGRLGPGARVNLELSLKVGDEIGGHFVAGHVDGMGRLLSAVPEGGSQRMRFSLPRSLARFVAEKGSICIDGVSLTVTGVGETAEAQAWFEVALIPHTLSVTTLGELRPGDAVNLEVDLLARYVARMVRADSE
jgi:riboflavin synthase